MEHNRKWGKFYIVPIYFCFYRKNNYLCKIIKTKNMKKISLCLFTIISLFLVSCESSDSENTTNLTTLNKSDIVGVWKSGNYFISFSSDNYYEAYLNDTFIDSGTYSLTDTTATVNNNYLSRRSIIKISKRNNFIKCHISYTTNESIYQYIDGTYNKSEDIPTSSNHIIIGKSDTWLTPNFSATTYFTSNYGGYEEVNNGDLKGIKRDMYYLYLYPYIYMQRYETKDTSHGSNTFNKDIPEILIEKITVNNNGTITF